MLPKDCTPRKGRLISNQHAFTSSRPQLAADLLAFPVASFIGSWERRVSSAIGRLLTPRALAYDWERDLSTEVVAITSPASGFSLSFPARVAQIGKGGDI